MNTELELLTKHLENNKNANKDELIEISKNIDKEIEKLFKRKDPVKYYKNILNNKERQRVVIQIKEDLLDKYSNMPIMQLDIIANNIYDFCCLKVHQISQDDIKDYILYQNNTYAEKLSEEEREKLVILDNEDIRRISQKYEKIVKSN